jgi:hypothetical protein
LKNWRQILSWKKKFEPGVRVRINNDESDYWAGRTGILIGINHIYDNDEKAPVWNVKLDEETKLTEDNIEQFYQVALDLI